MIGLKKVILTFCICLIGVGGMGNVWASNKTIRDFHEFELWHKLLQYGLSPSGEWAMLRIQAAEKTDTLFVRHIASGKEYKYKNTSAPEFSKDSHWIVFSEPAGENAAAGIAYQVKLVCLTNGEEQIFRGMESFTFTNDSKYLILKGINAGGAVELNLYDLEKKRVKNIANIQEYTVDPTGKYLAYTLKTEKGLSNSLEVLELNDYRLLFLENDKNGYEKLKWTDHGLLFMKMLSDSTGQKQGREIHVVRNIGNKQQACCFAAEAWADFPANMKISEYYTPQWSADGKKLFFGIAPERYQGESRAEVTADVDIWHWKDQEIQSRQKNRYYLNRSRTYLCVWWPEEKRWRQLADSSLFDIAGISADGAFVLAVDDQPYRPHYRELHRDIYVIQTETGKRTRLLENTILSASFSREGKYVYYFKNKNWWAYDLAKEEYINLTAQVTTGLSDIYYDGPIDIAPSFGIAGWLKEDKAFWFYDEYDIWSVEPATLKLKRLTRGREDKITFRKFQRGVLTPGCNLLLRATGDDGASGIYRFDPKGHHRPLLYGPFGTLRLEQSADKKMNLLGWADNITAPELFVCDENLNRLQQLTHTNLRPPGFIFRKSELIRYKNSRGKELKGALFYPVNYREGQSYPMIVHIYEKLSQHLNDFVFPSASDLYNTMNYVLQGYFVFQPDITYEVNRPGESAVDCVTAAVRQVLKREDIDPARLGLIGHSWGAYQTAYIITQTPLFAAAVAGAPLTDMISMYNSIYWESGRSNQEMFETGQARFRLPWWQISRQYICNSPVFQAENIQTPLLMIFGTEDQAVDWSQGLEMYITMRRLGKPCILLTYEGEGHTIGGQMNTLDQTGRVMDYFDYYLKKTVAADWILEGRTYLKKKGEE